MKTIDITEYLAANATEVARMEQRDSEAIAWQGDGTKTRQLSVAKYKHEKAALNAPREWVAEAVGPLSGAGQISWPHQGLGYSLFVEGKLIWGEADMVELILLSMDCGLEKVAVSPKGKVNGEELIVILK
jgi:hypothetical protein